MGAGDQYRRLNRSRLEMMGWASPTMDGGRSGQVLANFESGSHGICGCMRCWLTAKGCFVLRMAGAAILRDMGIGEEQVWGTVRCSVTQLSVRRPGAPHKETSKSGAGSPSLELRGGPGWRQD